MSLHLDFEPHSWYMGFAIRKDDIPYDYDSTKVAGTIWGGYIENGNTYQVDTECAQTLAELKRLIRAYHINAQNGYGERIAIKLMNKGAQR